MNKLLGLMHDTSGKTNRIRLRVEELLIEIKAGKSFNEPLTKGGVTIEGMLHDIKNQSENLDKVLDNFYLENKATE